MFIIQNEIKDNEIGSFSNIIFRIIPKLHWIKYIKEVPYSFFMKFKLLYSHKKEFLPIWNENNLVSSISVSNKYVWTYIVTYDTPSDTKADNKEHAGPGQYIDTRWYIVVQYTVCLVSEHLWVSLSGYLKITGHTRLWNCV